MTCQEIISSVPRLLEDTLSEHERLLFTQHLQRCERCHLFCLNARRKAQAQGRWLRVTAVLNVFLVISAIIYFMFGSVIAAKVRELFKAFEDKQSAAEVVNSNKPSSAVPQKLQPYVQLKPLHWDMHFSDRSQLDTLGARLRAKGIKVLYEDSGLIILAVHHADMDFLSNIMAEAGGTFQGGGSVYSFKLPVVEGDFRISINLKFPQSRVSQPLAHHWHLSFQLPNRFMAKDAIRATGARFLYEAPEIWVVQIPGRDFNQLKEVLRSTHGVEVNFGPETVSADSYGKIPVTVSLYISEG